jgi:hypothetical protein
MSSKTIQNGQRERNNNFLSMRYHKQIIIKTIFGKIGAMGMMYDR